MKKEFLSMFFLFLLLSSTAFAMVGTGEQSDVNMNLKYPLVYLDNKEAQDTINSDIANYVDNLKDRYYSGNVYQAKMSYNVMYENNQYLSITIISYWYWAGAAHGMYTKYGLVYDKNTGARVPVSNFVSIATPEQIDNGIRGYVLDLLSENGNRLYLGSYARVKRISSDYYLGGNGTIYLIYQPYELSSFSNGATSVKFTLQAIDYFNRRNNN